MVKLHKTDGGRQSSGYGFESKDCTVRSFACAADVPYNVAHDVARRAGRKNSKGWWPEKILTVAVTDGMLEFQKVPVGAQHVQRYNRIIGFVTKIQYPTVEQVVRRHPKGRYIISTCNHAMALIDGVIHDGGLHPKARVTEIFEVKLKSAEQPLPAGITQPQINELWERLNRLETR